MGVAESRDGKRMEAVVEFKMSKKNVSEVLVEPLIFAKTL